MEEARLHTTYLINGQHYQSEIVATKWLLDNSRRLMVESESTALKHESNLILGISSHIL